MAAAPMHVFSFILFHLWPMECAVCECAYACGEVSRCVRALREKQVRKISTDDKSSRHAATAWTIATCYGPAAAAADGLG